MYELDQKQNKELFLYVHKLNNKNINTILPSNIIYHQTT